MEHKLLPVQTKYVDRHRSRVASSARLTSSYGSSASVEFLLETLNALPQHIAVLDEKGVIISVNDSWKRFARENGWRDSNFGIGTNYLKTCNTRSSSDSSLVKAIKTDLSAILRGERSSMKLDYPCHSPTEKRWFTMHASQFIQQRKRYVVISHENVTHLKTAADRATQLAAIVDSSDAAIVGMDLKGVITSWNSGAERIYGYTAREMIGKNYRSYIPKEQQKELQSILRRVQQKGAHIEPFETKRITKDGRVIDIFLTVSPTYDSTGNVIGISNIARDITKRKQAEQALEKSETINRTLIQSLNEGVMMQTTEGKVLSYNQQAKHIFGLSDDHFQGKAVPPANWYAVKPDGSKYDENDTTAMDMLRSGKSIKDLVLGIHKPNGQITWISANAQPIYMHNKKHPDAIVTSFSDITERRNAEEAMQRLTEQLQRSNRELQDFASVASHDLQEPLRKVQAFGDRLQMKYSDKLSEEGRDYLSRMQNAALRMQTLINDLLQFSRVTTKAQPFSEVNLQKITEDVLCDLEIRIEQRHATVIASNLPIISADPMQMRQLFQNLIGNSLKFIDKKRKPKILITSKLLTANQKKKYTMNRMELRFKDNGIGFDEKYLDRIFNVFQRLHGQQEYSGTGVGLAVCRKIVERHHGTITARSKEGKGTTFIVTLPLQQSVSNERSS